MVESKASLLQMNVTQGAPFYDSRYLIKPCNWVKVSGQPGNMVECTVGVGGLIYDANGNDVAQQNPYRLRLDNNGFGSFRVVADVSGANNKLGVLVSVNDPHSGNEPLSIATTFNNYRKGTDAIKAYAYTIGAPNDKRTPCGIYALVNRNPPSGNKITILQAELDYDYDSSAILGNSTNPKKHAFPLNPDGSVQIDILDAKAEKVSVKLWLPESGTSDGLDPFDVQFRSFP